MLPSKAKMLQASPPSPALGASNAEARVRALEKQLRLIEDEHQHELERKVELERTVENEKSKNRSLSQMRVAEKRQTDVLRVEIDTLRGLLQGRDFPPPNDELRQVDRARAAAEARAEAATAQLDDIKEAMEIRQAEAARQVQEVTLLRKQLEASANEKIDAERRVAELTRQVRSHEQRATAHEAQASLLQGRTDAAREREQRAAAQIAELRRQLEASHAQVSELSRAHAEERSRTASATAVKAAEASSRQELKAQLVAAEARLAQQGEELIEARKRAALVDAERAANRPAGGDDELAAQRMAMADALANAERAARYAREALDAERFSRVEAEGKAKAALAESAARKQREEKAEEELVELKTNLRKLEGASDVARGEADRERERAELHKQDREEMAQQLEIAERIAHGHAEREAGLLAELETAKRAQAEAERLSASLQVSVKAQEARALSAEQRLEDAQAAMGPLRQQAEHAKASVDAFEARLSDGAERLADSEARAARLQSELLRTGELEARRSADVAIDAEAQLSAARAEIAGWSARQGLLLSQLEAERDAGRAKGARLLEAQEALGGVKELVLSQKEEELADAHRSLRAKEADALEATRRCEHMAEQLRLCREELKLRSEQQRLSSEQLRTCQEALRGKENELSARSQMGKAQQARADGANLRLQQTADGSKALHTQLASSHERIAQLGEEVNAARAIARRAEDEAAAARDEKAMLEALAEGANARVEALGGKVKASRDARLLAQQTLEAREAELRATRQELATMQAQLAQTLERQLREAGVAKAL